MKKLWVILLIFAAIPQVHGETLGVSGGHYSSVQGAINASDNGDIVIVDPGTYYEKVDFLGKSITVRSTDPNDAGVVAATIIDGSMATDPNNGSVVTFKSGEGNDSVLTGFTITGGIGTWLVISWNFHEPYWNLCGGGVVCYNMSEPTITKNVFVNNTAGEGGGIYIYGDPVNFSDPIDPPIHLKPIIANNTFLNNSAVKEHGYDPPNNDYTFAEHGDGGAIVCFQGVDAQITGNLIQSNSAVYYGGGLHIRQWSNGEISDNQILNNNSMLGSGIHVTYISCPVISYNIIQGNTTVDGSGSGGGGGIYLYYYSDSVIEHNVISGNEDPLSAGIAVYWSSESLIQNNLITKNIGVGIRFKGGGEELQETTQFLTITPLQLMVAYVSIKVVA